MRLDGLDEAAPPVHCLVEGLEAVVVALELVDELVAVRDVAQRGARAPLGGRPLGLLRGHRGGRSEAGDFLALARGHAAGGGHGFRVFPDTLCVLCIHIIKD